MLANLGNGVVFHERMEVYHHMANGVVVDGIVVPELHDERLVLEIFVINLGGSESTCGDGGSMAPQI